ncbi:MAG TPA: hypothetical protein VF101_15280 [Gaiellaceae bacterium]
MASATAVRVFTGTIAAALVMVSPAASADPHGGAGVVSERGFVGPLRIDRSTPVQVQAFAGRADYIGAGRFRPAIREFVPFIALGYGCRHARYGIPTMRVEKDGVTAGYSHVDCRTVYWINQRTGLLAGFSTDSRRFRTPRGVHPGTSLAEAKRREHRSTLMDSPSALDVKTANAELLIYATIVVPKRGGWRVGRTVAALALESRRHMIGLEFV